MSLFNAAWICSFLVYHSGWIEYDRVSMPTLLIIWVAVALSNLGVAVGVWLTVRSDHGLVTENDIEINFRRWSVVLCLFLYGLLAWLLAVDGAFGLNALTASPGQVRSQLGGSDFLGRLGVVPRFAFLMGPVVIASALLNRRSWPMLFTRKRQLLLAAILLPTLLVSLARTLPFLTLAWVAGNQIRRGRTNTGRSSTANVRRVLVIGFVSLLGMAVFQLIAVGLGKSGDVDPRVNSHLAGPLKDSPAAALFLYVSGGIPAFDDLVQDEPLARQLNDSGRPYPPGLRVTRPVAEFIPGTDVPPSIAPFTETPIPFNVYTAFEPFYRDYGPVGVFVGALVVGLGTGFVHARSLRGSPRLQMSAAFAIGIGAWGPFTDRITQPFIVANIIVAFLISARPRTYQRSRPTVAEASVGRITRATDEGPSSRVPSPIP